MKLTAKLLKKLIQEEIELGNFKDRLEAAKEKLVKEARGGLYYEHKHTHTTLSQHPVDYHYQHFYLLLRQQRALAAAALIFVLVWSAHRTAVTLGLGWTFLVAASATRGGVAPSLRRVLLVYGPVLLGTLLVAMTVVNAIQTGVASPFGGEGARCSLA